jgi:topoisomerase-4 subunit A
VADREQNWLASVTTEGRLLVFKISDLPQLGRARATRSSVFPVSVWPVAKNVTDIAVLPEGATLVLQAGKRTLSLKADDLEHYKVSVDVVVTNCHVASSGWMRCSSKTSIRRKRP